jgi:protein-S-isoprenylcysteine O-methyltransferase Ste14
MSDRGLPGSAKLNRRPFWPAAILAATLVLLFALGWWTVAWVDRQMRTDLLQETRLVAEAIKIQPLQELSGTEADLVNPTYNGFKEQLTALRSANPQCRFAYIVGRKANGTFFFFVDSEPATSDSYSPPGEVYAEAPAGFCRVFESNTAVVEGPYSDRWGVWISGLVPMINPQTGAVEALLGMDVDASFWNRDMAAKAALPIGLMLVLIIVVVVAFFATRRGEVSQKPIMRRLLPSLAATVVLLMAGAVALLWQQHQQRLTGEIAGQISMTRREMKADLDNQTSGLTGVAQTVAADVKVRNALRREDAERLLADWRPVFETLRQKNHITSARSQAREAG